MLLRVICAATLSTASLLPGSPDPARDIIAKAVESERENRRRMVNYLFLEEISRRGFDRHGTEVSHLTTSHEVIFIEGRPAFRMTSTNGRPLTPDEEKEEFERLRRIAEDRRRNPQANSPLEQRRRAHPFHRFLDLHNVQMAGEEDQDGRRCWVIESKPNGKAKPGSNRLSKDDRRITESTARFWIDKETFHRVRMDVTAMKPSGPAHLREWTSYHWAQRDGSVWLITSIQTLLPLSGRNGEIAYYRGEQRYSKYRRFTSESSVSDVEEVEAPQE